MFVWMGDPIAFSLGSISMRWYGLLFAMGFVIGYFMMIALFKRKNYNTNDLDRLLVYIFVGTVLGARLGHCLVYEPDYFLSNPLEILKIWKGGLASHGGTVGVLLAFFIFVKRNPRYSFLDVGDMLCIPIALVCTFIRLGNFMNSEILGKPTGGDFGVVFARLGEDFPRYPAQLFEAGAYFITFIVLASCYFLWKSRPKGMIIAILFFFIYTSRFFIEPFKEEQADYSTGMLLNVGQLLSIPFILGAIVLAGYLVYRQRQLSLSPEGESAEVSDGVESSANLDRSKPDANSETKADAQTNSAELKK